MRYFICLIVSIGLGGLGAWAISHWGHVLGVLDRANRRSSHDGVVPKGGGIGILAAFLFLAWLSKLPTLLWVCPGLLSLFSFYGDRKEVPAKIRLCVQFVAAIGLLVGLFHWEERGWLAYLLIPIFSVFVVGTANYYNFMDGINGIAGVTGLVGFGLIALFAGLSGANEAYWVLALCMMLGCVGFLPFNMPTARVFMGDVGSVLLGFVFAGLVVGLARSLNDFLVLCAFMFPFYADELTTEYVRLRDGENLLQPHRRHVYQLLVNEIGIDHWKVSVGYGLFQLLVGISILIAMAWGLFLVLSALVFYFFVFATSGYLIRSAAAKGIEA